MFNLRGAKLVANSPVVAGQTLDFAKDVLVSRKREFKELTCQDHVTRDGTSSLSSLQAYFLPLALMSLDLNLVVLVCLLSLGN